MELVAIRAVRQSCQHGIDGPCLNALIKRTKRREAPWLLSPCGSTILTQPSYGGRKVIVEDLKNAGLLEKIEDQRYLATLHATLAEDDGARRIQNQILAELRL